MGAKGSPVSPTRSGLTLGGPACTLDYLSMAQVLHADYNLAPLSLGLLIHLAPARVMIQTIIHYELWPHDSFWKIQDALGEIYSTANDFTSDEIDTRMARALDLMPSSGIFGTPQPELTRAAVKGIAEMRNSKRPPTFESLPLTYPPAASAVAAIAELNDAIQRIMDDLPQRSDIRLIRDLLYTLKGGAGTEVLVGMALSQVVRKAATHEKDGRSAPSLSTIFVNALLPRAQHARTSPPIPRRREPPLMVSPDSLADDLTTAIARMRELLATSTAVSVVWARRATDQLAGMAAPILDRTQLVTTSEAAVLRILSLCLAAEADTLGEGDLAGTFRTAAATFTWLEQRHSGKLPAEEALILAIDS